MSIAVSASHVWLGPSWTANRWLEENLAELTGRASACFARTDPDRREEAVAEITATSVAAAHSAARRGTLARLTANWCVIFGVRRFKSGRRFAGSSSRCVMSERTQALGRSKVESIHAMVPGDAPYRAAIPLAEALADRRAEDPYDIVRREYDYTIILGLERVSVKAKDTFCFLAETHGAGQQLELAATLRVSGGRISQLKQELAEALAKHDYHSPLGPRPSARGGAASARGRAMGLQGRSGS